MVELIERNNDVREFEGTVVDITRSEGDEKYPPQYTIRIKARNTDWKEQTTWISIPRTTTSITVPKKSLLGLYIQRLSTWGITAETHQETIHKMIGKTFLWKDENPKIKDEYLVKKDKLLPQKLIQ